MFQELVLTSSKGNSINHRGIFGLSKTINVGFLKAKTLAFFFHCPMGVSLYSPVSVMHWNIDCINDKANEPY